MRIERRSSSPREPWAARAAGFVARSAPGACDSVLPTAVSAYIGRVAALPGVKDWIDGALAEQEYLDFEEPYRKHR